MQQVDFLMSLIVGLGLAAACGFRVFVPLLVTSIAAASGNLKLSPDFAWIGTAPAVAAFSVATLLEVAGYYIPVVDNFLDSVTTPAAIVAGTIVTASFITDVSPMMKWSLAVVAGGGIAGVIQGATVVTRAASTGTTAGLANPLFATVELGGSIVTSILAVVAPIVALVFAVIIAVVVVRMLRRRSARNKLANANANTPTDIVAAV